MYTKAFRRLIRLCVKKRTVCEIDYRLSTGKPGKQIYESISCLHAALNTRTLQQLQLTLSSQMLLYLFWSHCPSL